MSYFPSSKSWNDQDLYCYYWRLINNNFFLRSSNTVSNSFPIRVRFLEYNVHIGPQKCLQFHKFMVIYLFNLLNQINKVNNYMGVPIIEWDCFHSLRNCIGRQCEQFRNFCFLCQSLKHSASYHKSFLPLKGTELMGNAFIVLLENVHFCSKGDNCFQCECNSSELCYYVCVEDSNQKILYHFSKNNSEYPSIRVFIYDMYFRHQVLGHLKPKKDYYCVQGNCHFVHSVCFSDLKESVKTKAKKLCTQIPSEWHTVCKSFQLEPLCLHKHELSD